MRRLFVLLFFLSFAIAGMGQEIEVPEGYEVDTLLKESSTHPGVYDTIITFRKVNVVRKEVVIEDTSDAHSRRISWIAGVSGGYLLGGNENLSSSEFSETNVSDSRLLSLNIFTTAEFNNVNIRAGIGLSQLQQQWHHSYQTLDILPVEYLVEDTLDVFYVEDGAGGREPHYVVQERSETSEDTTITQENHSFRNSVTSFQAGVNLGYEFVFGKWNIRPGVGYTLAVPVSSEGTSITGENTYRALDSRDLTSFVHSLSFDLNFGYVLSPAFRLFLGAAYVAQMNPAYQYESPGFDFLGAQGGITFLLRSSE